MEAKEAIEVLTDKNTSIGTLKCDDTEWKKLKPSIDAAVEALEKQIPKNPIEYEDKYYGCPACGNPVMHKWEKYPTILNDKKNGLPYCLGCGQALDWGENSKD